MSRSSSISNMSLASGWYYVEIHGFNRSAMVNIPEKEPVVNYAFAAYRQITGKSAESGRNFNLLCFSSHDKELFFSTTC